jgi:hypothetical protein
MKVWSLAVGLVLGLGFGALPLAGQTTKLHEQTNSQGKTIQRPYISYAEFQAASVGSAVSGKTTSGKTSGEKVTFKDLITVSTFDEVTRVLGKLTLNSFTYPDGQTSRGHLHHDGSVVR